MLTCSKRSLIILLCLAVVVERCDTRRGGIGGGRIGGSRGSSGARMSSSRGGGLFGRGSSSGISRAGRIGGHNGGLSNRGGWGTGGGVGSRLGTGGGWGNRQSGGSSWGRGTSSWGRTPKTSSFSRSGIGSLGRSSTFKNAIVGAAAGYLTYQAGKALIRSAVAPMMWNHRPYYWGSSYYPQSMSRSNMCRMPIDASDPKFGNVYFEDGSSRPKEIVWSCGYNEDCCGYECCPSRRGGWGYGGAASSWRFGLGIFVLVIATLCCGIYSCRSFGPNRQRRNFNRPFTTTATSYY